MKSAFVSINKFKNEFERNMLVSSLSFLHPMKVLRNDEQYVDFKLYDCDTKEKLNEKLDYLCEASSVDFGYRYAFVD